MEAVDTLSNLAKALERLKTENNPELAASYLRWAQGAGLESTKMGLLQFLAPRAVGAKPTQLIYTYDIPFRAAGSTVPVELKIAVGTPTAQVQAEVTRVLGVVNPRFSMLGREFCDNSDLVTQYLINRTSDTNVVDVQSRSAPERPLPPLPSPYLPERKTVQTKQEPGRLLVAKIDDYPKSINVAITPSMTMGDLFKYVAQQSGIPLTELASVNINGVAYPSTSTATVPVGSNADFHLLKRIINVYNKMTNTSVPTEVNYFTTFGDLKSWLEQSKFYKTGTVTFDLNGAVLPDDANVLQTYAGRGNQVIALTYELGRTPVTIQITRYVKGVPTTTLEQLSDYLTVSQLKADYASTNGVNRNDVAVTIDGKVGEDRLDLFTLAKDSPTAPIVTVSLRSEARLQPSNQFLITVAPRNGGPGRQYSIRRNERVRTLVAHLKTELRLNNLVLVDRNGSVIPEDELAENYAGQILYYAPI